MMKQKLSLVEAKARYAQWGTCDHEHLTDPYSPHGCEPTKIVTCKICAREMARFYA